MFKTIPFTVTLKKDPRPEKGVGHLSPYVCQAFRQYADAVEKEPRLAQGKVDCGNVVIDFHPLGEEPVDPRHPPAGVKVLLGGGRFSLFRFLFKKVFLR
jgi:hypothetical protein